MGVGLVLIAAAAGQSVTSEIFDLKSVPPAQLREPDCRTAAPGEVVVCAQRKRNYRLDPAALAAARAKNALPLPPDKTAALTNANPCKSGIGPNGCTGTPDIDFVAVAIVAAKVAVDAMEGEDWRENLRTQPDEYREYLAAKERQANRRPSVTISAGTRAGSNRRGQ
jgi:hypothetical protein